MGPTFGVLDDLRMAARTLSRSVWFSVLAILVLGVGLGAAIAAFSAFDAVLARDLPVRRPEELVTFHWLRTHDSMVAAYSGYGRPGPAGTGLRTSFSAVTFERFRAGTRTLSHVFAFADRVRLSLSVDGLPEIASGQLVSGNYYTALGVPALRGRVLTDDDDRPGAHAVAVITYRYWQRRFAADEAVVGRTILVNRSPVTIAGITPEGFDGTLATETSDLTLPLGQAHLTESSGRPKPRSTWWLRIMGRARPGISIEQVSADLQALFEASVHESWAMRPTDTPNPGRAEMPRLRVVQGRQGPDGPRRDALADLLVPAVVGGTILVVGCANVATLLLVRGARRRREIGIRLALGATRMRIVRWLLSESVVLAFAGGALGLLFAYWARNFVSWLPAAASPIIAPTIDTRVILFALVLTVATVAVCGLAPALRTARRTQIGREMKLRGWRRLASRIPIIVQVAGSVLFLGAAGLAARSVDHLDRTDLGFDPGGLLLFRLALRDQAARALPSPFDELTDAIAAVPGVRGATFSAMPLVAQAEWTETVQPDAGEARDVHLQIVRPGFFPTIGTPVILGRDFSPADRPGEVPVAVINERMARVLFGDQSAVGRYVTLRTGSFEKTPRQVIGVAGDARYATVEADAPATLYLPSTQAPPSAVTFEVRSADPAALLPIVRGLAARQLPGVALTGATTMRQQIEDVTARPRHLARVAGGFGLLAVLLACVGLYGIVSYDLTERVSEFGVRIALGASPRDLATLVVRDVLVAVAIGSGTGLTIAATAAFSGQQYFPGVSPLDPVALVSTVVSFTLAALAAVLPPTLKATRLAPVQALKRS